MSAPRLEIDLAKVGHNARVLVERLGARGISVTGVTKAALGLPALATTLLDAGVSALGDSRIENLEGLRAAGITAPTMLIRSSMISQASRVVASADVSCNTEVAVLTALTDRTWFYDARRKNMHVRVKVKAGEDCIINLNFE